MLSPEPTGIYLWLCCGCAEEYTEFPLYDLGINFHSKLTLEFIFSFLRAMALSNTTFIIQHVSKILGWELSETAWPLVTKNGGSFITTALVLPILTSYLLGAGRVLLRQLDLGIIGASLLFLTLGNLCIAEARSTLILVTGKST